MADVTVLGAQHPGRGFADGFARGRLARRGQGGGFRLDDAQGVAVGAGLVLTGRAILAGATVVPEIAVPVAKVAVAGTVVVTLAIALAAVLTGPLVPGTIVARTVIAGAVIAGTLVTLAVIAGAVITLAIVAVAGAVVVAGTIVPLPVVALAIVARTIIALAVTAFVAILTILPVLAIAAGLVALAGLGLGFRFGGLGVGARFVLEIDVVAGHELVAADDFGQRTLRLHGAQDAEIVLRVLQVVLGQHAVAGGTGVPGELLVLLIDVLCGAADLDPVRPVGIEGPVGVVLGLAPTTAAAATATAVPAPLTLHTLEISHAFDDLLQTISGRAIARPCGVRLL